MDKIMSLVSYVSKFLRGIGAVILSGMMLFTVADVIMRYFGKPILGSYEVIALAGAIVIGFIVPQNSLEDKNVYVDSLITVLPRLMTKVLMIGRRLLGIALFVLLAYGLFMKGAELFEVQEVSYTLHIPLGTLGYALGTCALIEALVLSCLLARGLLGRNSE